MTNNNELNNAVEQFKLAMKGTTSREIERLESSLAYNLKEERFQDLRKESKREIKRRFADSERTVQYW